MRATTTATESLRRVLIYLAGSSRENEWLFIAVVCGFAQYTATLIAIILIQIIGAASV